MRAGCAYPVSVRGAWPKRFSSLGDYRSRYGSRMPAAEQGSPPVDVTMDEIVALCKRRGFVFPSSEIYGGVGSTYDFGHYGVLLKNNVKAEWWRTMLQDRDDIVALDSAIIQHPRVWEASGHLEGFTDPLVQCLGSARGAGGRITSARRSRPRAAIPRPSCAARSAAGSCRSHASST